MHSFKKTRYIALLLILLPIISCSQSSNKLTPAEKLAEDLGIEPVDYSQETNWACLPWRSSDPCNRDFTLAVVEKDGSYHMETWKHNPDAKVDCFYIYPTVDLAMTPGNHDDLSSPEMQQETAKVQAGLFSSLCRVFAPLYRQVTLGTYFLAETNVEEAVFYFKKALLDVASGFEYYLEHWNKGHPVIMIGHSQGAQMITYLLRKYFDNDETLRSRLVVALPIGFSIFVPENSTKGGSLENIPICTSISQTGCIIHFRSYQEGFNEMVIESWKRTIDTRLAEEDYLFRAYNPSTDHLVCVNPATRPVTSPYEAVDINGNIVESENLMILEGFVSMGLTSAINSDQPYPSTHILRERYAARCKKTPGGQEYLAISYLEPDSRYDPINLKSDVYLNTWLGLHLFDFNLTLPDLLYQVHKKIEVYMSTAGP